LTQVTMPAKKKKKKKKKKKIIIIIIIIHFIHMVLFSRMLYKYVLKCKL